MRHYIKVGDGPNPEIGFQVVVDYIAMNEQGLIFDNSLEKGKPNDIRITGDATSALVIAGLDEGILTMKSGGIRRLYIPVRRCKLDPNLKATRFQNLILKRMTVLST